MYDADLSMKLSQHLFDLQLGEVINRTILLIISFLTIALIARYIQRTNEANYASRSTSVQAESNEEPIIDRPRAPIDTTSGTGSTGVPEVDQGGLVSGPERQAGDSPPESRQSTSDESLTPTAPLTEVHQIVEQLKANQDQTNQRLDTMQDRMKETAEKVTGMMIKLHNHSAQVRVSRSRTLQSLRLALPGIQF